MEKDSQSTSETSVTKEVYQGPGRFITSAGYVAASHGMAMIGGIVSFAAAAFFAHEHINNVVGRLRNAGEKWGGGREWLINGLFGNHKAGAELRNVISCVEEPSKSELHKLIANNQKGVFEKIASKVAHWLGHSKHAGSFLENQSEEKLNAMFIGGGIGGVSGWLGSTVWGIAKGTHHGNKGIRQFSRAQEEIKNLREDNADLNSINDELHAKYVRAATRLNTMERDSAMRAEEAASFANTENTAQQIPAPKPEVQLDAAEHLGKLAQPEREATLA